MSLGSLGRLGIELYADTATFTGDLGKAQREAKSFASNIESSIGKLGGIFTGIAAGIGAIKFVGLVDEVAKARDGLQDLADAGLGSVEQISALKNTFKAYGGDFDAFAGSLGKMVKGLAGSEKETSQAGEALKRLGIDARDATGALRAPTEIFKDLSVKLAGYADGADKAAYAQAILGKGAEKFLPILKDMAEEGEKAATVTEEQAAQADQYGKAIRALEKAFEGVQRRIAGEFIPVFTALAQAATDFLNENNKVKKSVAELSADGTLKDWAFKAGQAIAFIADAGLGVVRTVEIVGKAIGSIAMDVVNFAKVGGGAMMTIGGNVMAGSALVKEGLSGISQMGEGFKADLDDITSRAWFSDRFAQRWTENMAKIANAAKEVKPKLDSSGLGDKADRDKKKVDEFAKAVVDGQAMLATAYAETLDPLNNLAQAEKALIKLRQQPEWKTFTDEQRAYLEVLFGLATEEQKYVERQKAAAKVMQDSVQVQKQHIDGLEKQNDAVRKQIDDAQLQIDTYGLSKSAVLDYTAALLEQKAATTTLDEATKEDIALLNERARLLREMAGKTRIIEQLEDQRKKTEELSRSWEQFADMGGRFFSDLAMNGRSAFDRLRDSLKSFAAELIALMAKRWILNLVAGPAAAGAAGQGSLAGSLLGSGFGPYIGAAALGGLGGYLGAGAMGAGQRGQQVGGVAGAGGAALGMYLGGPVGAVIGALAGAVIGKFTDPNGLAQRTGNFGDSSLGGDTRTRGSSIFGGFGITSSKWFGDDMIEGLKKFFDGLGTFEDSVAKYLKPEEIEKIQKAFAGKTKEYGFGIEHGDFSGTLGQIFKDRLDEIIQTIDPSLQKWVDAFKGTGDELGAYVLDLLHLRDMLGDGQFAEVIKMIPDLTVEGIAKMQQAGESLSDTFTRVVNEFLSAQAALNAAIASRNPTFARELVLSQRNTIARSFADSLGLLFDEPLLQRMALNPQSFTGLNTQQMKWLADFLGLQTQLEQLDQQLAQGTQNITVSLGNFDNAINNTINELLNAQSGLADYLRGSLTGQLSPLNPLAQLAAARDNYTRNLGLAQGGDPNAISAFGGLRDEYLRIARSIYASSGAYNDIFFSTFNQGAALTGGQVTPLTGATYTAGVQQLTASVQSVQASVQTVAGAVIALGTYLASPEGKDGDPAVRATLDAILQQLRASTTQGVLA